MYLEITAKFKIRTFDLLKITFCSAMCFDLNKFIRKFHNYKKKTLNNVKITFNSFAHCSCFIIYFATVLPQIFSTRSHNLHLDKLQEILDIVRGVSIKLIDLEIMKNNFVTFLGKKK